MKSSSFLSLFLVLGVFLIGIVGCSGSVPDSGESSAAAGQPADTMTVDVQLEALRNCVHNLKSWRCCCALIR